MKASTGNRTISWEVGGGGASVLSDFSRSWQSSRGRPHHRCGVRGVQRSGSLARQRSAKSWIRCRDCARDDESRLQSHNPPRTPSSARSPADGTRGAIGVAVVMVTASCAGGGSWVVSALRDVGEPGRSSAGLELATRAFKLRSSPCRDYCDLFSIRTGWSVLIAGGELGLPTRGGGHHPSFERFFSGSRRENGKPPSYCTGGKKGRIEDSGWAVKN